jgi:hypothetical protein
MESPHHHRDAPPTEPVAEFIGPRSQGGHGGNSHEVEIPLGNILHLFIDERDLGTLGAKLRDIQQREHRKPKGLSIEESSPADQAPISRRGSDEEDSHSAALSSIEILSQGNFPNPKRRSAIPGPGGREIAKSLEMGVLGCFYR